MERRGLVLAQECTADGRGAFIELTPAGADAIGAAAPRHVATVRGLVFDRLSDAQRAAFEEACAAIVTALSEQALTGRGRRGPGEPGQGTPVPARPEPSAVPGSPPPAFAVARLPAAGSPAPARGQAVLSPERAPCSAHRADLAAVADDPQSPAGQLAQLLDDGVLRRPRRGRLCRSASKYSRQSWRPSADAGLTGARRAGVGSGVAVAVPSTDASTPSWLPRWLDAAPRSALALSCP